MTITPAEQVGQAALSGFAQYENEIAELKRQLEEANDMAKRCSDWGEERRQSALDACEMAMQRKEENEALRQQLAESQAREARLREALEYKHDAVQSLMTWCIKNINRWSFPQYDHLDYANAKMAEALALPHDDTALKEYRDAVIDDCIATTNQVLDGLEGADNVADALRVMKGGV